MAIWPAFAGSARGCAVLVGGAEPFPEVGAVLVDQAQMVAQSATPDGYWLVVAMVSSRIVV